MTTEPNQKPEIMRLDQLIKIMCDEESDETMRVHMKHASAALQSTLELVAASEWDRAAQYLTVTEWKIGTIKSYVYRKLEESKTKTSHIFE